MKKFSVPAILLVLLATMFVVPSAHAQANCFQQFVNDSDACSYLSSWIDRTACEADAEITLAGCVRRTILAM
jgi:hypothetical protein